MTDTRTPAERKAAIRAALDRLPQDLYADARPTEDDARFLRQTFGAIERPTGR